MVKEVTRLTNIKLTESDADGIWLHFDGNGKACGIALSTITILGNIANEAIMAWAREQLDKQDVDHRRFYLHPDPLPPTPSNEFLKEGNEKRTDVPSTRPSHPVEGGY